MIHELCAKCEFIKFQKIKRKKPELTLMVARCSIVNKPLSDFGTEFELVECDDFKEKEYSITKKGTKK